VDRGEERERKDTSTIQSSPFQLLTLCRVTQREKNCHKKSTRHNYCTKLTVNEPPIEKNRESVITVAHCQAVSNTLVPTCQPLSFLYLLVNRLTRDMLSMSHQIACLFCTYYCGSLTSRHVTSYAWRRS